MRIMNQKCFKKEIMTHHLPWDGRPNRTAVEEQVSTSCAPPPPPPPFWGCANDSFEQARIATKATNVHRLVISWSCNEPWGTNYETKRTREEGKVPAMMFTTSISVHLNHQSFEIWQKRRKTDDTVAGRKLELVTKMTIDIFGCMCVK